jgi:hypothetical protein
MNQIDLKDYKPKITHKEFQNTLVKFAKWHGWKCQYWWKSIHSPAGFPDVFCCKPPYSVYFELKVKPDKASVAQQEWIDLLSQLPNTVAKVVYYDDWDYIVQILSH